MSAKENNFSKVCTEMLEVFKYIPEDEFCKIELDFIETIYHEHDTEYEFKFDQNKKIDEQAFLPETYDMLAYVYRKYLCDNNQEKEEFKEYLFKNLSNDTEIKTEIQQENKIMLEEKNTFLKKITNFIKRIIKIK